MKSLFVLLALFLLSRCSGIPVTQERAPSAELNTQNEISVCYDYSCKHVSQVELKGSEWNRITQLFDGKTQTSQKERLIIAKAIALMEQLTGNIVGTSNDQAGNSGTGEPGQMDCIDESINTTAYLRLFENKGWIKWHQVEDRVRRNPFLFDIHWTAVIKDKQSNQLYAVDSWFRENGREPVIIKLKEWKAKKEEL